MSESSVCIVCDVNGSLRYTIPTYVYMPTHKSLCHLLIGLVQPCPVSETVCLLALAVQSPSTNFSLLRKKKGSETSLALCCPKPKDPSSDICRPQASPRRCDQTGLEKGSGCVHLKPTNQLFLSPTERNQLPVRYMCFLSFLGEAFLHPTKLFA